MWLIEDDTSILQSTSESCDCPRNIASCVQNTWSQLKLVKLVIFQMTCI